MRNTTTFMKNWLFTDLDGSQTKLDLPHTWNALDGQDGGGYLEVWVENGG